MDKQSERILKVYTKYDGYSLRDLGIKFDTCGEDFLGVVNFLRRQGYLVICPKDGRGKDGPISLEDPIYITQEGRAALEKSLHDQALEKRGEIRDWATFAIAAVTLIVAVISLVLQLLGI